MEGNRPDGLCGEAITLRRSLILALLLSFGLGLTGAADEYQWTIETVWVGGGHVSIIRASDGTLHGCFELNDPCCSPGYTYRGEDGWSDVERVDPDNLGGDYAEIGLNATGYPVIAYQKENHLWVAVRSAEGWTTELVDDRAGAGKLLDLAIDASGRYHIIYSILHMGLHYAVFDGLEWTLEQIRTQAEQNSGAAIAVDSQDYPHVSYCASVNSYYGPHSLGYGFKDELGWHFETVDGWKTNLGVYTTIELDASDNPHICYR
ncbi:MAG: hypothetical protein KAX13_02005, partial [Candidatus Krumholzibacteria bacterium]|nr:hypothetical protein [Candidatus Krumholzibacteria bacterium]